MSFLLKKTIKGGFRYYALIWLTNYDCGYKIEWQGLIGNASKWPEKHEVQEWINVLYEEEKLNLEIIEI